MRSICWGKLCFSLPDTLKSLWMGSGPGDIGEWCVGTPKAGEFAVKHKGQINKRTTLHIKIAFEKKNCFSSISYSVLKYVKELSWWCHKICKNDCPDSLSFNYINNGLKTVMIKAVKTIRCKETTAFPTNCVVFDIGMHNIAKIYLYLLLFILNSYITSFVFPVAIQFSKLVLWNYFRDCIFIQYDKS